MGLLCCSSSDDGESRSDSLLGTPKGARIDARATALITSLKTQNTTFSSHVEYGVQLRVEGLAIPLVWKRYSDFEALNQALFTGQPVAMSSRHIALPSKHIGRAKEALQQRRTDLELYLHKITSSAILMYARETQSFFQYDFLEALAANPGLKRAWERRVKAEIRAQEEAAHLEHKAGNDVLCDLGGRAGSSSQQHQVPPHWEGNLGKVEISSIHPSRKECRDVLACITPSTTTSGIGRSFPVRIGVFEITKVERVQNMSLWRPYCRARQEIAHSCQDKCPTVQSTCQILDDKINEVYLLIGTTEHQAFEISRSGFTLGSLTENMPLGDGLYFCESAAKADAAGPVTSPNLVMIVTRVILGRPAILTSPQPDLTAPPAVRASPLPFGGTAAHSVIGDLQARGERGASTKWRDFVVYDRAQAYPEYLIYYDRTVGF